MRATVDVVIPVYNEERQLPRSILILSGFLKESLANPWRIVIADNGSTDQTLSVAEMLSQKYSGVTYLHIPQKGRGRALRHTWLESTADIVSYMDVDLSTNLSHFPKLVEAIEEGYHIAVGSRLSSGAKVKRSLNREVVSRGYNLLIRSIFFTPFHDAQCGFKALTRATAQALVPLVQDNNWFFDSELLIIAAKRGFQVKEVPVEWVEDPDSRVRVLATAWEDLKGLLRLRFGGIPTTGPAPAESGERA